ncbi:thymidine kinase [Mesoplasma lactucae]|uniref:Thymidine kinase n=1 Tax=Mesoplasma lactucae ATCC 49193 TaxID=81460 RepID=A0A291IST8_9MOLU|nr:thymidine kinase [Mesoplasma lactucae]ATG97761.1 thymidine kinase [Mesoplasma lactucae ATCC 49193]ATZ20462.1 thymidine kinase [Mesoplasma lactucae ATCC 49193]MCL8216634.1 Thymidine kinase [Mesoplasma lactucae ATCC 49193]
MTNTIKNTQSQPKMGWIELITGCMFAGKTEEFIRRLRKHYYGKRNVLAFKPSIDDRYDAENIATHSGDVFPSFPVKDSKQIREIYKRELEKQGHIDVVGIDEVQFLDTDVVQLINDLADEGVIVIVTGLDKDFKLGPFQNVDKLLYQAEYVDKLHAVCSICGANANRSQRMVNGQPAKKTDPIILVSGKESYEARCRFCYIPAK